MSTLSLAPPNRRNGHNRSRTGGSAMRGPFLLGAGKVVCVHRAMQNSEDINAAIPRSVENNMGLVVE